MTLTTRLRAACAVGAVLALAACTANPTDGPTSTSASTTPSASVVDPSTVPPTSPASPTASADGPSAATLSSSDPAAQEAADRAAVEKAWSDFWPVSDNLWRLPEEDRPGAASAVAVDPTLSQVVERAKALEEKGLESYGQLTFHPYWEKAINNGEVAVMGDCTDTSQSGAREVATGAIRTIGIPQRNTRATFVRGQDGIWRVANIEYLVDEPCP